MRRTAADDLPDQTQSRILLLVENSQPNMDRPRMSDDIEKALCESDRRCAAMYTLMEETAYKCRHLAQEIDGSDEWQEDSIVRNINPLSK